ncbi:dihydropteroate synthase [Crocinitomix catalasitica]|uniref:dihydropteroate synthase n=1 Tax=Crocinitomix catalasitica TaxID=184607 RepID=UPI0006859B6B|nr:dihydropteroate synthase [Crocinitomix catalasitica]
MGILNINDDSFYAGSRLANSESAIASAEKMINDGATIIDVGGYSSRPGADNIPIETEIERISPVIRDINKRFPDVLISIDTFRSEVAKEAIKNGAHIINDISGGGIDSKIYTVAAENNCPYILMHMRGTPQNMVDQSNYKNLFKEVFLELSEKIANAKAAGINDIIIDPGFGFSKTIDQNFELLQHLKSFAIFDRPLLIGISRKSMIYKTLQTTAEESLNGTTVLNTIALMNGAKILRVHDVKEAVEAVKLVSKELY